MHLIFGDSSFQEGARIHAGGAVRLEEHQVAPVLAGMPRPQVPVAVRDADQTDTQALLAEAGLEPGAIERLRADGIIS